MYVQYISIAQYLELTGSDEESVVFRTLEIFLPIDNATVLPRTVLKFHTHPLPRSKVSRTHKPEMEWNWIT